MRDVRSALFSHKHVYDLAGTEVFFVKAVRDNAARHRDHCPFYRDLLTSRSFDVDSIKTVEDCARIPVIPASFFKYHVALSMEPSDSRIYATSSGTQGQKTQMYFDRSTLRMGVKMVTRVLRYYRFISPWPVHYIILGYEPDESNPMGSAQTAMGITRFAPALRRTFVLRHTPSGYEVDAFGMLRALQRCQRLGLPVRLVGFPSYLYMLLTRLREMDLRL
jgi:phenylacetate-coenzyme A ligase PaaK-like adenylate-forming protein